MSSRNMLKDFNWEVKMTMSSDSVSTVNEPLVSLQLNMTQGGSESCKQKILELSKEELQDVIESLTKASDAISAYTS